MTALKRDAPLPDTDVFDLCIIGGGINGAGIARDAAGRGLKVLLVERSDWAGATSQWSTKLLHGGLRYLENYEFKMVGESLREREILMRLAPHLSTPQEFILPHQAHLRPRALIRAGLFLYDWLGGKKNMPSSHPVPLTQERYGAGLKEQFTHGFSYYDAQVDDARLVLANVRSAVERGAQVWSHTEMVEADVVQGVWQIGLSEETLTGDSRYTMVAAKALINASGPWVLSTLERIHGGKSQAKLRHVKGSHIVVPRVHTHRHAYILQQEDKRIIFVIPWFERYSLIGTTEVEQSAPDNPRINTEEISYLCSSASRYLSQPVKPADVIWSYSGIRPLYNDGGDNPSANTRDYVLESSMPEGAPLINVFGGKLTTYRHLAEDVLDHLQKDFPQTFSDLPRSWTDASPLPGGDIPDGVAGFERFFSQLQNEMPVIPEEHLRGMARRHGTSVRHWLTGIDHIGRLGQYFGSGLYASEVDYMIASEWVRRAEDVLWRRTKCGLSMSTEQQQELSQYITRSLQKQETSHYPGRFLKYSPKEQIQPGI